MRECSVCRKEEASAVVSFPLLREGYPMGPRCHAAWRGEAQALGPGLGNPAKVRVAFQRWLEQVTPAAVAG